MTKIWIGKGWRWRSGPIYLTQTASQSLPWIPTFVAYNHLHYSNSHSLIWPSCVNRNCAFPVPAIVREDHKFAEGSLIHEAKLALWGNSLEDSPTDIANNLIYHRRRITMSPYWQHHLLSYLTIYTQHHSPFQQNIPIPTPNVPWRTSS